MSTGLGFDALFDPAFLDAVTRWRHAGRRVAPRGGHGPRLSPELGGSVEFKDYRPYSAGDDLRAIDWNLYRRLNKVFVRLFEKEENMPVYLLPDLSRSLFVAEAEEPPALVAGLRTTLALGAMGLEHNDPVGLLPFGETLEVVFRGKSGSGQIVSLAQHLARLAEGEGRKGTNLVETLRQVNRLTLRRGVVVVVSDFFDPAGVAALGAALRSLRHRVLAVQLVRRTDEEPTFEGDVRLVDAESGDALDLVVTAEVKARYLAAYQEFNDTLAAAVKTCGGQLLRVRVDRPLLAQLSAFMETGGWHS